MLSLSLGIAAARSSHLARSLTLLRMDASAVIPVRCGELSCQKDSYTRSIRSVVVSCEPKQAAAPEKGKPKKKGSAPPPQEDLWDVVLSDTVIFPEGGGQPADSGSVGGVVCVRADNVNGICVHTLKAPLSPGDEVDVEVDWARREDNMAQHSTQHLVTAIALRKWGFETISWSLGESTAFLELGTADFTEEQRAELEVAANEAVRAGVPVTPSWHSVADVNDGNVPGLRKSSKPLPPSVTGPVRVVSYQGIDTNTCCGTHVGDTAKLQAIKLLRLERSKAATKVHFVAGGRVLSHLGALFERSTALAARLAVTPEMALERFDETMRKAAETEEARKALAAEVVALTAAAMRARLAGGERVLHARRASADAEFLRALASSLDAPLAEAGALLLVTIGEGDADGSFFLAGPPPVVEAASAAVATMLEGRGGGKNGRYQGKCSNLGAAEAAAVAAAAVLPATSV